MITCNNQTKSYHSTPFDKLIALNPFSDTSRPGYEDILFHTLNALQGAESHTSKRVILLRELYLDPPLRKALRAC